MQDKTNEYFKHVNDRAAVFHDQLKIFAIEEQSDFELHFDEFSKQLDDEPDNKDLMARLDVFGDSEILKTILEQSKEFMDNKLNSFDK